MVKLERDWICLQSGANKVMKLQQRDAKNWALFLIYLCVQCFFRDSGFVFRASVFTGNLFRA